MRELKQLSVTLSLGLSAVAILAGPFFFVSDALAQNELAHQLEQIEDFVSTNCIECHDGDAAERNFDLANFDFTATQFDDRDFDSTAWEKMLRRLETRQMPPPDASRPDEDEYVDIVKAFSTALGDRAKKHPQPGRVGFVRRLTRAEYQNAIRDLLGIQIDAAEFLPKDQSSHGFDNITVEKLSPTLMNRYLSAAQKISRLAMGSTGNGPSGVTIRVPADRSQEEHVEGLPFGTRGGIVFDQHFPQTGEYEIELKLARDRDEKVEGLNRKHEIDILVDRERVHQFTVQPPEKKKGVKGQDFTHSDSHLKTRLKFSAGKHTIGVTFPKTFSSFVENKRQPFDTNFNRHRHPRKTPAIFQTSIVGPFASQGHGDTTGSKVDLRRPQTCR